MKLQPLTDALEIWQKNKYVDINNFYYDLLIPANCAYADKDILCSLQ